MNEKEIVQHALSNLQRTGEIEGNWLEDTTNTDFDGAIDFVINGETVTYNVEIKKELRKIHLPKLEKFANVSPLFMVLAQRIFPSLKQELRNRNIAYLEANGNIYIKNKGVYLWLDANPPIAINNKNTNRAFTKTGLKVVYQFLLEPDWINKTYREIAEYTNTGIGTITNIFKGLKNDGFLVELNPNTNVIQNKTALLDKWMLGYEKRLKPNLFIGTYRFVDKHKFDNWNEIKLKQGKTFWGGEPAGDCYTNYLRPEELTMYTTESRNELMKNYKLIPDENGNIKVYEKFWNKNNQENVVHPLLAYIDLILLGDRRSNETAQKIYNEYLHTEF